MDLSILIATVPPRKKYLNRLLTSLQNQIVENNLQDKIEVIVYEDDFETVVGYKFNKLVESAKGTYSVILGDDDMVSDDYCKLIIEAIKSNPGVDQIPYRHKYFHNGEPSNIKFITSKKYKDYCLVVLKIFNLYTIKYRSKGRSNWQLCLGKSFTLFKTKYKFLENIFIIFFFGGLKLFSKTFFVSKCHRHTCLTIPIKTEIAKQVKYSDRIREQDIEWATDMFDKKLIKTEFIIDKELYYYYYDEEMSINRGKSGWMSIDEKRKKLNETLKTIKDIDWVIQPIDKVDIKWI
jgi:hypothetical protein